MSWRTHLLVAHVQELIELNATVGEGTESPLLLEISGDLRVSNFSLLNRVRICFIVKHSLCPLTMIIDVEDGRDGAVEQWWLETVRSNYIILYSYVNPINDMCNIIVSIKTR